MSHEEERAVRINSTTIHLPDTLQQRFARDYNDYCLMCTRKKSEHPVMLIKGMNDKYAEISIETDYYSNSVTIAGLKLEDFVICREFYSEIQETLF